MSVKKDLKYQDCESFLHVVRTPNKDLEIDNFIEYINTSVRLINNNSSEPNIQSNNLLHMIAQNGLKYTNDICDQK
jgi:DNA-binding transcriptional regulator YiaG